MPVRVVPCVNVWVAFTGIVRERGVRTRSWRSRMIVRQFVPVRNKLADI